MPSAASPDRHRLARARRAAATAALAATVALVSGCSAPAAPEAPQPPEAAGPETTAPVAPTPPAGPGTPVETSSSPRSATPARTTSTTDATDGASAAPTPRPRADGVLRIALSGDRPGLSTGERDDTPDGFDADAARATAMFLGYEERQVQWVWLGTRAPADALSAGIVDLAVGGVPLTPAPDEPMDVAGPYLSARLGVLVPADSSVAEPADLEGGTVCVESGSPAAAALRAEVPGEVELLVQGGAAECLPALRTGRVDAIAGDEPLLGALSRADEAPEARLLDADLGAAQYGVGLPEDSTLCDDVTAALASHRADGGWARSAEALERASGVPLSPQLRLAALPDPDRCDRSPAQGAQ